MHKMSGEGVWGAIGMARVIGQERNLGKPGRHLIGRFIPACQRDQIGRDRSRGDRAPERLANYSADAQTLVEEFAIFDFAHFFLKILFFRRLLRDGGLNRSNFLDVLSRATGA